MKSNPEQSKLKVLDVLFEIYEKTKYDYTKLSLSKICENNKYNNRHIVKVIKNNLVDYIGGGNKQKYKWKTIRPNFKMAEKAYDEAMIMQLEAGRRNNEKQLKTKLKQNNLFTPIMSDDEIKSSIQEQKILNILLEIYELTKIDYTRLSILEIVKKNKLALFTVTPFIKELLYFKTDGKHCDYKWKSKKPNIEMAKKIYRKSLDSQAKKQREYHQRLRRQKVDNIGNNVEEVKKDTHREENKTISILWGLVKININK